MQQRLGLGAGGRCCPLCEVGLDRGDRCRYATRFDTERQRGQRPLLPHAVEQTSEAVAIKVGVDIGGTFTTAWPAWTGTHICSIAEPAVSTRLDRGGHGAVVTR